MTRIETEEMRQKRYKRIRLIKKIMRPMPRKSNIHRYPILKYFAATARKRTYLWEFRRSSVIAGLWIGWFIALIPIYSIQMISAFILCIPLRGNALIAMALQWTTNPVTIPFILYFQYKIGDAIFRFFGGSPLGIEFSSIYESIKEQRFIEFLKTETDLSTIWHIIFSVLSGGLIISIVCAAISTWIYLFFANKSSVRINLPKNSEELNK